MLAASRPQVLQEVASSAAESQQALNFVGARLLVRLDHRGTTRKARRAMEGGRQIDLVVLKRVVWEYPISIA